MDQRLAAELAAAPGLIVIAGRYEGLDERVCLGLDAEEISIGDYVLSGGELAAGVLIAWDPANQREVWRVERGFYSGSGLLSTHGNLVFQGDLAGNFSAYTADTGQEVWSYPTQGGIMASPIAYQLDDEQYIARADRLVLLDVDAHDGARDFGAHDDFVGLHVGVLRADIASRR